MPSGDGKVDINPQNSVQSSWLANFVLVNIAAALRTDQGCAIMAPQNRLFRDLSEASQFMQFMYAVICSALVARELPQPCLAKEAEYGFRVPSQDSFCHRSAAFVYWSESL